MKKNSCILLLILLACRANGQILFTGHIKKLNKGIYAIYVHQLTGPVTDRNFVDSFPVNKNGSFGGRIKKKYPDGTIFRASVYSNGSSVNPLNDALLNNSILFTNTGTASITITAVADTLFYDATVESPSAACRQITKLEALKKPLYAAMQQTTANSDSSNLYNRLLYEKVIAATDNYRQAILRHFTGEKIPAAALLCLYNLSLTQIASIAQPDTALLYPHIRTLRFPKTKLAEILLSPFRSHENDSRRQTGHIAVTALTGAPKKLAELVTGDTIAVIDYWASWCGPCRKANTTYLPGFARRLTAKGIAFCSVSIDTDIKSWKKAMAADNIKWPQYIDGTERTLYRQLGINAVPYYTVINRAGNIIFETHSWLQLDEYITAYTARKH